MSEATSGKWDISRSRDERTTSGVPHCRCAHAGYGTGGLEATMADRDRNEDLYRLSVALTDDKYEKAVELMNRWIAERVIPDGCAALLLAMLNQAEEWHGGYDMLNDTCEEAL